MEDVKAIISYLMSKIFINPLLSNVNCSDLTTYLISNNYMYVLAYFLFPHLLLSKRSGLPNSQNNAAADLNGLGN